VRYDPAVPPDPTQWLALDEGEQIVLVEEYHRRAGIDLPQATLHAAIHAVIEQQLAAQLAPVANAFERLRAEGLDRHDTVHALGAVLAEHMRQLMIGELDSSNPNASYFADMDRLTAESWRSQFGLGDDAV
jgi:UDP-N-acetylmuramyl tripeptide synthase